MFQLACSPTFTRPSPGTAPAASSRHGPRCRSGLGAGPALHTRPRLWGTRRRPRSSVPPVAGEANQEPRDGGEGAGRETEGGVWWAFSAEGLGAGPLSLHHQVWLGGGTSRISLVGPKDSRDPCGDVRSVRLGARAIRVGTNGPPLGAITGFGGPPQPPDLLHQALQEHRLLTQWVVSETIAEGDDAVGEVVLRQPGHHAVLLHIRTARHVHDQVARVLPVSAGRGGGQPRAPGVGTSPHSEWGREGAAAPT